MSVLKSIAREIDTARILIETLRWTNPTKDVSGVQVADDLEAACARHSARLAIRFEGEDWSYGELDARANQYAHWALAQGLVAGDTAALFMGNRPDYIAFWYGMAKVGVVTALINSNLRGQALAHSVAISGARHMVFGADLHDAVAGAREAIGLDVRLWSLGGRTAGARDLDSALDIHPGAAPGRHHRASLSSADTALLTYTSGTTGMPKAARMSHMRVRYYMRVFIATIGAGPDDRIFITLPLYHSTGGLCAVGVALLTGAGIVLKRKFSARRFWSDATAEGASLFVYVGELCRYLLSEPEAGIDRAHSLRAGFGNGLRPETWERFSARFGIARLKEFYGSTEGNTGLINFDGRPGAVGRVPPWIAGPFSNIRIVRFDRETETPVRGAGGLCIEAGPGETGELLGRIGSEARMRFDGYSEDQASERKIIRDVLEPGDAWFRSGDLMSRDALGYFYFVDRIGDTFRWKGENVSTTEVADVLTRFAGVATANVYGVRVDGQDGRAGMAALTLDTGLLSGDPLDGDALDLTALAAHLDSHLPGYARPVFLRLSAAADTTPTLKLKKRDLMEEGFDPGCTCDRLYWRNGQTGAFEVVTAAVHADILAGRYRL